MEPIKPAEELYNLEDDPHQIVNLADQPQYSQKLLDMKAVLFKWMVQNRDLSLIPEPLMRNLSGDGSPRSTFADPDVFPLQEILNTADLIGRGPEHLEQLRKQLSHPDPAVRYWAATGLRVLESQAEGAAPELEFLLVDESKAVRIAAAEALVVSIGSDKGMDALGELLLDDDILVRIYAAMALIDLGEKAKSIESKIEQSNQQKSTIVSDQNYETYLSNALTRIRLNIDDSQ